MKITFLLRALNLGGAQSQMVLLAKGLKADGHDISVIAFYDGVHKQTLLEAGVDVQALNKRSRWDVIGFGWRLLRLVRRQAPDVLYGYLPVSNLLTGLLKPFVPGVRTVWGIRTANLKLEYYDWLARLLGFLELRLARFASLVLVNSRAGYEQAIKSGVPAEKLVTIWNGIDTDHFHPNAAARAEKRARWKVVNDEILIGIVGRIDPVKEHKIFLSAAAALSQIHPNTRFVCIGEAANPLYQQELEALTDKLGLQERVLWIGAQYDMLGAYNALDILTNCSSSEGFSNVIGEAMACGVTCVVTDVGDSALIVGNTGIVIKENNSASLVQGWLACLSRPQRAVNWQARQRIIERFGWHELVNKTEAALLAIS